MRYLSLCSGIEAATVAWHPMGWEPAAFAEIEPFPAAVLKHHYPNTPNLGDMTKWREWNVGPVDLLVGGTPCQSFSVAGLRKGLSDPRGGLMLTFLEIAQSLRPRWVVWENVPGVLSSAGGRDFGAFLGALGELGYGWAYRVLDAQWCRVDGYERAVPQRRRRVFVVGCLGDGASAAKVLFEQQSVERNPASRGKARQGAAVDAEGGVETGGWMPNNPGVVSSVCAKWAKKTGGPSGSEHFNLTMEPASKWPADVCSTLNASFGEKQGLEDQHAFGGAQCFVPAVAGTIDCDIPKQRVQNMAAGHWLAVAVNVSNGGGYGNANEGLGITIDGTGPLQRCNTPAVAFKPSHFTRGKDGIPSEITPPLSADADKGDQDTVVATVAHPINGMCLNKELRDKQMTGIGGANDPMFAVRADGTQHAVATQMVVRRLTPVECERLQGFPDGYTNIPWRGKPESPDGPRYKALGNSMAVNCMRWIGRRIDAVENGTELAQ